MFRVSYIYIHGRVYTAALLCTQQQRAYQLAVVQYCTKDAISAKVHSTTIQLTCHIQRRVFPLLAGGLARVEQIAKTMQQGKLAETEGDQLSQLTKRAVGDQNN